jgi:hypothetical protein
MTPGTPASTRCAHRWRKLTAHTARSGTAYPELTRIPTALSLPETVAQPPSVSLPGLWKSVGMELWCFLLGLGPE